MQFKETITNLPWPDFFSSSSSSSSSSKSGQHLNNLSISSSTSCMEQLLAHCAHAIDSHDATLAQQLLWVLHNIAPPDGDSNQRLTSAFLRALLLRASRSSCPALSSSISHSPPSPLPLSPTSLASFIDLTPSHRFGFSAANSAIADATDSFPILHIVHLSTTHAMQLPTLIETLSSRRPDSPPFLRLTLPSLPPHSSPPPSLDIPLQQLASRLVLFARSRNISMEFTLVHSTPADGFSSLIEHLRLQQLLAEPGSEALVINSHSMLHFTPDESSSPIPSSPDVPRTTFLNSLRALDPTILILVEEDADFTSSNVVQRLRSAFNYMWIPFDAVDTFLPKAGKQRRTYEEAVCWKIENAIANEGLDRVERLETKAKWVQRLRAVGFSGVAFGEDALGDLRSLVDQHSAGWGVKRDEDDILVLTWKGHDVLFASAWMPSSSPPPPPPPLIL